MLFKAMGLEIIKGTVKLKIKKCLEQNPGTGQHLEVGWGRMRQQRRRKH